jgi:hypothetical protein
METLVTNKVTPTERKIAEMLLENTGTHMLDSGGVYGRRWEQMRDRFGVDRWHPGVVDYDAIAAQMRTGMRADIDRYGSLDINVFFFLTDNLDYDEALAAKYDRWQRVTNFGKDRYDKDWGLPLMDRFLEQLAKHAHVSGIYGDGNPVIENTYNGECSLSHTLQFAYFTVENLPRTKVIGHNSETGDTRWIELRNEFLPDGTYVLLQIHNGCDVRGGYTDPVLFGVNGEEFFSYSDASVTCQEHEVVPDGQVEGQIGMDGEILVAKTISHRWYTDDGYHWYGDSWPDVTPDLVFDRDEEDRYVKAVWDEEAEAWMCPIDGTKLEVWA